MRSCLNDDTVPEIWFNCKPFRASRRGFPAETPALKPDRLVKRATLRTSRAIDVGVVGINEAAFATPENMILARRRAEPLLPPLVINPDATQGEQENRDVRCQ